MKGECWLQAPSRQRSYWLLQSTTWPRRCPMGTHTATPACAHQVASVEVLVARLDSWAPSGDPRPKKQELPVLRGGKRAKMIRSVMIRSSATCGLLPEDPGCQNQWLVMPVPLCWHVPPHFHARVVPALLLQYVVTAIVQEDPLRCPLDLRSVDCRKERRPCEPSARGVRGQTVDLKRQVSRMSMKGCVDLGIVLIRL